MNLDRTTVPRVAPNKCLHPTRCAALRALLAYPRPPSLRSWPLGAGEARAVGLLRMKTTRIRIRKARITDCDELTEIAHAAKRHWGYPARLMRLWKSDLTVTPEAISSHRVYCAVRGSTVVGFYALSGTSKTRELEHMWVRPEQIRSGVGRALFTHLLEHLQATDATRLVIASDPNAEGFYRSMGAQPAGRVPSRPAGRYLPRLVLRLRPRQQPNKRMQRTASSRLD